jgi:hypothetical protein
MSCALIGDLTSWPEGQRNLFSQRFLGTGESRVALSPEEIELAEQHAVGSLRTALSRYPDDPGLRELIDELIAGSPRFQSMWRAANFTTWRSTNKTIDHPDFGLLILDCDTLLLPDTDQSMIVYSAAAGTREASALDMMRITGTERMTVR